MSRSKPEIGVTGPDIGGEAAWWFTWFAVWLQGGRAVRITPSQKEVEITSLDGLILGGGADINPKHYGAKLLEMDSRDKPKPSDLQQWLHFGLSVLLFPILFIVRWIFSVKRSDSLEASKGRDDLEFALLREGVQRGIPILGICRGSQLINVQFKGSLYQDISSFYTETPQIHTVWPEKKVQIKDGSKLRQIIRAPVVWVNALHNQAVSEVGQQLRVAAAEGNGVIQAIEHTGHSFLIGVQWHPEYMPQIPFQRQIFRELVQQARKYSALTISRGASAEKKLA